MPNKKIKDKMSKKKTKDKKVKQKGGDGQCSRTGPKMIKKDPPNHAIFQTGQTYGKENKNATDWSNTMNMSSLYPGMPPKPPFEDCVIM
jgi:hypothetical protein